MSVARRFNSRYSFEFIKDSFINKFKQIQIINTTSNAKTNSTNPNVIVFGKDILHDLSKNSIPIQTLVIAIPPGISATNRLNHNTEIASQIKAKSYYNINTQNLKSLIHKTHKFNPSEVFGSVLKPKLTPINPDNIKSFSPYNTLLFDQNFSEGILSSLIRTAYGLGWNNILMPDTVNLFGPVSVRCSKGSIFFNNLYTYTQEDLDKFKELGFGFNFNLKPSEVEIKLNEINSLIRDESDKKLNFICFFGDNGGNNLSEKSNVDIVNDDTKFDPLIAGSLILSKLLQTKK
jgi:tRNA G18 (ribose-2'-O)-methylase SpoU